MGQEYSEKFKEATIKKLLGNNDTSMSQLCRELGLPVSTVYGWKKSYLNKGKVVQGYKSKNKHWNSKDKLAVIIETASMNQHEISEYCRSNGLYPEQIEEWKRSAFTDDTQDKTVAKDKSQSQYRKKIKKLESELRRKEKALAEAAALLVLSKKLEAAFGVSEDD